MSLLSESALSLILTQSHLFWLYMFVRGIICVSEVVSVSDFVSCLWLRYVSDFDSVSSLLLYAQSLPLKLSSLDFVFVVEFELRACF